MLLKFLISFLAQVQFTYLLIIVFLLLLEFLNLQSQPLILQLESNLVRAYCAVKRLFKDLDDSLPVLDGILEPSDEFVVFESNLTHFILTANAMPSGIWIPVPVNLRSVSPEVKYGQERDEDNTNGRELDEVRIECHSNYYWI